MQTGPRAWMNYLRYHKLRLSSLHRLCSSSQARSRNHSLPKRRWCSKVQRKETGHRGTDGILESKWALSRAPTTSSHTTRTRGPRDWTSFTLARFHPAENSSLRSAASRTTSGYTKTKNRTLVVYAANNGCKLEIGTGTKPEAHVSY